MKASLSFAVFVGGVLQSSLLATTSGSPSALTCTNKLHEMQVQVATHPSSDEAAAFPSSSRPRTIDTVLVRGTGGQFWRPMGGPQPTHWRRECRRRP